MPWQEHLANLHIFRNSKLVAYTSGEGWMTIVLQQVQVSSLSLRSKSTSTKKNGSVNMGLKKPRQMALLLCYTSQWHSYIENTTFGMPANTTKLKHFQRSWMGMTRTSKALSFLQGDWRHLIFVLIWMRKMKIFNGAIQNTWKSSLHFTIKSKRF